MRVEFCKEDKCIVVRHRGRHNHDRPFPIHPTVDGEKKFKELVLRDPSASPESLLIGSDLMDPVTLLDPAFINKGRVKFKRRAELQQLALEAPQELTNIDQQIKRNSITASSVRDKDRCIIMQPIS